MRWALAYFCFAWTLTVSRLVAEKIDLCHINPVLAAALLLKVWRFFDYFATSKERLRITAEVGEENPAYAKWRRFNHGSFSRVMKTRAVPKATEEIRSYVQLQRQIHDALRVEHPEWIGPNGECPMCEIYESRLAKLLGVPSPHEYRSAA